MEASQDKMGSESEVSSKPKHKPKSKKPALSKTKPSLTKQNKKPVSKAGAKVGNAAISEKNLSSSPYPRHSVEKALRIPKSILDQNAGRECNEEEAAKFIGLTSSNGPFRTEVSSAIKYGLLERPKSKYIRPTELAKKIIRPQSSNDETKGLQECILKAPVLGDVYKHYRGENIPDRQFFQNTLTDIFKIPPPNVAEFISIFNESLQSAKLIEKSGDKQRILDISSDKNLPSFDTASELKRLSKAASVSATDSCFVVMPFAPPLGDY